MPFSDDVAEELLVRGARHCCLCREYKGSKIEVHHIVAESEGGTEGPDNGIPVCFDCHAEVKSYNEKHPCGRKFRPSELKRLRDERFEAVASGKVPARPQDDTYDRDVNVIRFFSQCFDRPAFQDLFRHEGSIEDFDKAIEDTITAINTGCLRSRDGRTLARAKGKSFLSNLDWRRRMDVIVDLLRAIRSRYALGLQKRQIATDPRGAGGQYYCIYDRQFAQWMDTTRAEIIRIFSDICEEAGIPRLHFPRSPWTSATW